jgi:signal transduction histidine kinase
LTLQKRLTLFTLLLTTAITLLLGITLVENVNRSQLSSIDFEINQVANSTKSARDSLITDALTLATSSQSNLSLLIIDEDGEIYPILEQTDELSDLLEDRVDPKLLLAEEVFNEGFFRIRSVQIGGGDQLLVISDISKITDEKRRNYLLLFTFLFLSTCLSLALLRKVISRDVRRAITEIQDRDRLQAEKEKNTLLKNFISDASHELRTPLTVIKGYLEIWKLNPTQPPEPKVMELLLQETKRIERNITSLLEYLEQETIAEEELTPIELNIFIERELEIFTARESERDIEKNVEANLLVLASEDLLLRLLRNLFGNISQHTTKDKAVKVRAYKKNDEIILQVENHWAKDSTELMNFEKLTTRFNSTRSYEKGGSGLGFSIMNGAVTKMRGTLKVYQTDNGNFGVEVALPRI